MRVKCIKLVLLLTFILSVNNSWKILTYTSRYLTKSGIFKRRTIPQLTENNLNNTIYTKDNYFVTRRRVIRKKNKMIKKTTIGIKENKRNVSKTMKTLAGELFDLIPSSFDRSFKNPCWFDPRKKLQCFPYFYIAGAAKCGTTDVWKKIGTHPDIVTDCIKEFHFWTRNRFYKGNEKALKEYLGRQRKFASLLEGSETRHRYKDAIIGDASVSTMYDYRGWITLFPSQSETPLETHAHLMYTIQPNARIIFIFRNPTERMYSDYYYFLESHWVPSPVMFHKCCVAAVEEFKLCLQKHTLRTCSYSNIVKKLNLSKRMIHCAAVIRRIVVGIYDVYVHDWLNAFPRNQLFFMTTYDWKMNCVEYLRQIYIFLGADTQTDEDRLRACKKNHSNIGKRRRPPMLEETRKLLDSFYAPYMRRLANLLNDTKYKWYY